MRNALTQRTMLPYLSHALQGSATLLQRSSHTTNHQLCTLLHKLAAFNCLFTWAV
jgi:hypothetical protein